MKVYTTYLLALLFGIMFSGTAFAQKLTASAPAQVQVGQRFNVFWELNTGGSNFIAPPISDFQVLSGPNQSTSMQFINGSMSQSVSYSYILQATKEGEFTIAPAKIKVGSEVISSNEVTVKVIAGGQIAQAAQQRAPASTKSANTGTNSGSESGGKDIFTRLEINKHSSYLGEKITADLRIYTRVDIAGFEEWNMPTFEGFVSQEVASNQQIDLQNEVIDGVVYKGGSIKKWVLYPQKSGEIVIEPVDMTVVTRERAASRGNPFESFFGGYQNVPRSLRTSAVKINVKPYPAGKPGDFSGLTGNLSMKAVLDKNETKSNEAVNLKVTVSGDGNLYQLQPPTLEFPPDIEVYDPKISDNIKVTASGISGSRTFEYVLIPRYAGDFKIGPFSFSYFDAGSGQFKTITQDAFDLIVEKGKGETSASPAVNITSKEDIRLIGSDIRFIKQGQYPLLTNTDLFYRSASFYAAIGIPVFLFLLMLGYAHYQHSQGKDVVRLKSKRATGLAKKRLTKARKLWEEKQTTSFYEEVFKALSDYAAHKFDIPVSALSKDRIRTVMAERKVPDDTAKAFIGVLDKTEFARFAPGADKQMESMYEEALAAIVNVEDHA